MQALREVLTVSDNTLTIRLPPAFRARRVEVIVLEADPEEPSTSHTPRHRPSVKLAGTRILGDVMAAAVPAEDWDALK